MIKKTGTFKVGIPNDCVDAFRNRMQEDKEIYEKLFDSYTYVSFPNSDGTTEFTIRATGKADDVDFWNEHFGGWLKRHTTQGRAIQKVKDLFLKPLTKRVKSDIL